MVIEEKKKKKEKKKKEKREKEKKMGDGGNQGKTIKQGFFAILTFLFKTKRNFSILFFFDVNNFIFLLSFGVAII